MGGGAGPVARGPDHCLGGRGEWLGEEIVRWYRLYR